MTFVPWVLKVRWQLFDEKTNISPEIADPTQYGDAAGLNINGDLRPAFVFAYQNDISSH